jgi:hypothetical protein
VEQKVVIPKGEGTTFNEKLKETLRNAKDGAVMVSIQDGKQLHLTITEKYTELTRQVDGGKVTISNDEFNYLIQFIQSVRFGTVIVKIQNSKISEVEKNEKFKL